MPSRARGRSPQHGRPRSRRSRSRRPLLVGLGALGAVLVLAVGWLGLEASRAQAALGDATEQAQGLQADLTAGETDLARNQLRALQASTTTARTNTDGPLWAATGRVPFVGASVRAVSTAADSLDDIAHEGLSPLVESSAALDADLFRPEDGRFPLQRFADVAPAIIRAADVLTRNRERVDAIDDAALLGSVRGPVTDLKEKVGSAESAASAASRALRVAPELLGAEGRRTYLVMFQNNAESRATGGIPGALALVTAREGRLTFDRQFTFRDLDDFTDDPVLELTEQERFAFDPTMATDIRNVTFTPDFPRAAQLAREMVDQSFGVEVDGVMSIDPVALSYALEGTGPVEVGADTTLTSDNAVDTLLNTVYARLPDPRDQDDFFAGAATAIFASVLAGSGDSRVTLEALAKADAERRILLWSADEDVQAQLSGTRLSGQLPGESTTPHVGVYLNDATESKMQYYLEWDTTVDASRCTDEGVQSLVSTTTLTSTAPADAAELPRYITGSGKRAPEGDQQVAVRVLAPRGGAVESLEVDGEPVVFGEAELGERPVLVTSARIEPGATVELSVTMTTGEGQRDGAVVRTTPGVRPVDQDRRFASACS